MHRNSQSIFDFISELNWKITQHPDTLELGASDKARMHETLFREPVELWVHLDRYEELNRTIIVGGSVRDVLFQIYCFYTRTPLVEGDVEEVKILGNDDGFSGDYYRKAMRRFMRGKHVFWKTLIGEAKHFEGFTMLSPNKEYSMNIGS
ncbi:MAG: hypothetical protein EOO85_23600 [Pedobacter sp.]|nr:MAG: hypothetical protein EOO85_23600 [Pedobacter sp.]